MFVEDRQYDLGDGFVLEDAAVAAVGERRQGGFDGEDILGEAAVGARVSGVNWESLADEGVLIMGSGSLTHNLYEFRLGDPHADAYAAEFAHWVRDAVLAGDHLRLRQALAIAPHARRAHPTAEHYLPLLVAAGAARQALPASVIEGGIVHGVLSMDSFLFGADLAVGQDAAASALTTN